MTASPRWLAWLDFTTQAPEPLPEISPALRLDMTRRIADAFELPLATVMSDTEIRALFAASDDEWFNQHVRPHGGNT